MGNSPSTTRRNRHPSSDSKGGADNKSNWNPDDKYELGVAGDSEINESLDVRSLPSTDPLLFFGKWYEQAKENDGVKLVNSATLSTSSRSGRTSSRIVGVKGFDRCGFKIATNCNSLKAKNMEENCFASLLYYWEPLGRMVRIDGRVVKSPDDEMDRIWKGFSRDAQYLHTASHQDEVITSSEEVLTRIKELKQKYGEWKPIPTNPEWVAYCLIPEVWEFYQVGEFIDRVVFRLTRPGEHPDDVRLHKGRDDWVFEILSP